MRQIGKLLARSSICFWLHIFAIIGSLFRKTAHRTRPLPLSDLSAHVRNNKEAIPEPSFRYGLFIFSCHNLVVRVRHTINPDPSRLVLGAKLKFDACWEKEVV